MKDEGLFFNILVDVVAGILFLILVPAGLVFALYESLVRAIKKEKENVG